MMQTRLCVRLEVIHNSPVHKQLALRADVQRCAGTARAAGCKPEEAGGDLTKCIRTMVRHGLRFLDPSIRPEAVTQLLSSLVARVPSGFGCDSSTRLGFASSTTRGFVAKRPDALRSKRG